MSTDGAAWAARIASPARTWYARSTELIRKTNVTPTESVTTTIAQTVLSVRPPKRVRIVTGCSLAST